MNKKLKTILIIAAPIALVYLGFKGFYNLANDELSGYDGGRGKYEDSIENS